ncbi:hypothetical protein [Streptomyces sp. A5-4]|uniref:hypothetical protein n=1 Tax=Streptomyces sp. A5-4 TaxID=3384771 RepID=UPI003DA7BC4B
MWPGQQPPGGEQNPQDPNQNPYQQPGYQQPNPYQQPGYQQPNPYQQQPAQYGGPMPPGGPRPPEGNRKKTTVIAIVAATAVVAAAVITGVVVMGKDDEGGKKTTQASDGKDKKKTSPSTEQPTPPEESASPAENPRGGSVKEAKPSIPGWKAVTNPKYGTLFDVPPEWEVDKPGMTIGFTDEKDPMDKPLISMSAPAYYKSKWCTEDSDKDGDSEDNRLAAAGTRGANGASNAGVEAQNVAGWWVFSPYDQKKTGKVKVEKAKPFTTTSGLKGSYSTATVTGVDKKTKCSSDGKSIAFAFKNADGDFAVWNLYTAKGVPDELPDATIQKILATVRLPGA